MLPWTGRSDRAIRTTTVDLATASAQTIAPALAGRRVRIHGWWLSATTAGTGLIEDTAETPAELAPAIVIPAAPSEVVDAALETAADGTGVTLTTTTAVGVSGVVRWSYV
jgi:hypothetical protein